jgi:protein-disulfide isomerase
VTGRRVRFRLADSNVKGRAILRHKWLSIALVAALVVTASLVASQAAPGATKIVGASSVEAMLQGIPQQGIELGKPDAPVTLVEFVEPQCPGCGIWARGELPGLIKRYVRPGKIRIEYRGLSFIGPDSSGLLTLVQAAGQQNKLWNLAELEYANQGAENSGYATHVYLTAIAKAVPGLNADKALALTSSGRVAARIEQARVFAQQSGVNQTPTLAIRKAGDDKNLTVLAGTSSQGVNSAINAALAGKPVPARSSDFPAWAIVLLIMAGVAALSGAISIAVRLTKRPPAA